MVHRESRRAGRSVVQRRVLYLGEINDSQRAAWQKSIAVFDEEQGQSRQCALLPEDRAPAGDTPAVQARLDQPQLSRPRAWGACWLGDQLWRDLLKLIQVGVRGRSLPHPERRFGVASHLPSSPPPIHLLLQ